MYLSWEDTPDTPDTPSKSGLKWWGILLIVLSVIFVLGLGVIGFMKYKESKTANQSRLLIN
jgi:flagellar basal body-associated protein FliL